MKVVSTTFPGSTGRLSEGQEVIPSAVLGTWLFLFTEIMLFCGLVSAYLVLRGSSAAWPPPGQPRLPLEITAGNTLLLLASGITMWLALPALLREQRDQAERWLKVTFWLGAAFLIIQGYEWTRLVGYGLTTNSSLYGALFYTLIGTHGVHVAGALIALGLAIVRLKGGAYGPGRRGGLMALRLYWSFVVMVWPALYCLVYLM